MSTSLPNSDAMAAYKKAITDAGVTDVPLALAECIKAHQSGKCDPEGAEAFLALARTDKPQLWGEEIEAPAVITAPAGKLPKASNPFADETDAGEARRVSYIKLKGVTGPTGAAAMAAACDPPRSISGKLLRSA
jgi:hypothetical protein